MNIHINNELYELYLLNANKSNYLHNNYLQYQKYLLKPSKYIWIFKF